ncbi:MAG: hypothetical protein ACTSP3_17995 [Candidatus Heimdallarchaeaceae archaeon]
MKFFSGFSAAMIAFCKELGTELYCIQMEGVNYYFQTNKEFIFVVGMYPRVRASSARRFLRLVDKMIDWDKATFFQTDDFREKIENLILEFQIRFKHLIK